MGVDLDLLPFDCDQGNFAFSHTLLNCCRRRELWETLSAMENQRGRKVPSGFTSFRSRDNKYEEPHYGTTIDTPYGTPLKFLLVEDLLLLVNHEAVQDNAKNRAIWAYLAQLPPETKVALYWH